MIMTPFYILFVPAAIFCSSEMDVVQDDALKIVESGEDVNITCSFSKTERFTLAWFKQSLDGKPSQIFASYLNEFDTWNDSFEKTNRFKVTKSDSYFNLTILQTNTLDSATYFCVISLYYNIGMGAGTRLFVRASHDSTVNRSITLHQIDAVHPGASVNLQCSVFTESCGENHSIYWFQQSFGESGIQIYTKGERSVRCERETASQTQSCFYNLLKKNISRSDAGIYYCAAAACGQILFGRGIQLNLREEFRGMSLIIILSVLLTLSLTFNILLCSFRKSGSVDRGKSRQHQICATDKDVSVIQRISQACSSENADTSTQRDLKIVKVGENVTLTCFIPNESRTSVAWVKHSVGENPVLVAWMSLGFDEYNQNEDCKRNHFYIKKDRVSFNLSIVSTEESDTGAYFCVIYVLKFTVGNSTDLIVKASEVSMDIGSPGGNLQCFVVSRQCEGQQRIFWFRDASGESPPGMIHTEERIGSPCERNSTQKKCTYSLPERNKDDDGIHYCAVAACGEILFGEARNFPDFQTFWRKTALGLAISNSLAVIVIIFLSTQLCKHRRQDDSVQTINASHDSTVNRSITLHQIDAVHPGASVNLQCSVFTESCGENHSIYWFQQSFGESGIQIYTKGERSVRCERETDSQTQSCFYNLLKKNISRSDAGIYYCAAAACGQILFGRGIQLSLRASHDSTVNRSITLHQIDAVHPGASVNLQCSVFTESCGENHSIYWFQQSFGESGIQIYTKGERSVRCERETDSQTQSCFYNLLKKNISRSDAGIYYCAAAACGQILFGRGIQLNSRVPQLPDSQETHNDDSLNYAAIRFSQKPLNIRRARANATEEETLYSQVRSRQ
ncbi:hypothetical protein DNTS_001276 [Danionella cerebrum]|uniref:Ig-like domain-containing protein n=1 Tax=Danionella cerebrum TaxID=2873325 RepID=A0A553MZX3_9TELE|nr:hypothetical protein DNTS_001276 [Danionella translucida]